MDDFPSSQDELLFEAARSAVVHSYSPYSHYPVGAAVLGGSGRIHVGVNVESASYPAGTCAERVAIGCAISAGETEIVAVAVHSPKGDISPCGICRQLMQEFGANVAVIFPWQGRLRKISLSALLPYSFTKESLR